jgi:hypothetical protein
MMRHSCSHYGSSPEVFAKLAGLLNVCPVVYEVLIAMSDVSEEHTVSVSEIEDKTK